MSIDELARAAAAYARRAAACELNAGEKLDDLHRTHRARRLGSVVAVIAAVALISGGVAIANHGTAHSTSRPAASPAATDPPPCSDRAVQCLGHDRFRFRLTAPVVVALPATFQGAFKVIANVGVEDYRNDVDTTGVSVLEHAIPVAYDESWSRDHRAGTTAHSVALWLSKRPFLVGTSVVETSVGGRTAWRVSGRLRPNATLPAPKAGITFVAPTFTSGDATEGYARNLTGDYTLIDVPGAGVTVIWSWTFNKSDPAAASRALAGNQAFIDGLSFP